MQLKFHLILRLTYIACRGGAQSTEREKFGKIRVTIFRIRHWSSDEPWPRRHPTRNPRNRLFLGNFCRQHTCIQETKYWFRNHGSTEYQLRFAQKYQYRYHSKQPKMWKGGVKYVEFHWFDIVYPNRYPSHVPFLHSLILIQPGVWIERYLKLESAGSWLGTVLEIPIINKS